MKKNTILVADDEHEILELLKLYLEKDGYVVIEAYNGLEAWEKICNNHVDLAVVDVMMPGIDGFNLVKKIREKYIIPVIILSARTDDNDKILGLGLGADDYMAKPFNPFEVLARVQAQLRRFHTLNSSTKHPQEEKIQVGPFTLDKVSCKFSKHDIEIPLTTTEYKIIGMLIEQPGRVFTKAQIFEYVWGDYFEGDDNTLMVHIRKIREKIEDNPGKPVFMKTIRGLGYRFERMV